MCVFLKKDKDAIMISLKRCCWHTLSYTQAGVYKGEQRSYIHFERSPFLLTLYKCEWCNFIFSLGRGAHMYKKTDYRQMPHSWAVWHMLDSVFSQASYCQPEHCLHCPGHWPYYWPTYVTLPKNEALDCLLWIKRGILWALRAWQNMLLLQQKDG